MIWAFSVLFKKSLSKLRSEIFSAMFTFRSYVILGFILRFLDHFKSLDVYGMR